MAITFRFPVLLWQDHEGCYTASLLEWDEPAALASTPAGALTQLEEYLQWRYDQQAWLPEPDFLDPQLTVFKVAVRPEYQQDGRRFPCSESFMLRVHCVHGHQEHGLLEAVLPTFPLRFYYYEAETLRNLVTHYVQQALEQVTPAGLARYLAPRRVQLEQVVVTLTNRAPRERKWVPAFPALQAVAEPLGDPRLRRQFAHPWERDQEVADLVRRLGKEKSNVLLLGESGAGKTTVLLEAVRQLERVTAASDSERRPGVLARRYWQTSGPRLIAGMRYLGQWEERCETLIEELGRLGGVLCVENLLDLVREGGSDSSSSVANFFLPYLQRGELRMVGEATAAELDACRRLLPGFADVFQVLPLKPFTRQQAISVLDHYAAAMKQNLQIEVGREVVDLVYHLHHRFLPYEIFPGRAVAFLAQVFERARQQRGPDRRQSYELSAPLVVAEFIRQTGLPELFVRDEILLKRPTVLQEFASRIIGQPAACEMATNLVMTFKAGLNDPHRPVGVFLFCGPTGVGKTEMARSIAHYFFGHGEQSERLIRLDMSEYAGPGAADRLLARPDGHPSDLIQKLRQQPFVVLLLDEIEKADPEVFDMLLGVFDEGRLTDRYGRLTTFRSAIIVMTSNLGAGKQEPVGFGSEPPVRYEGEALAFFRPEFFNRIDAVVTFEPLSPESIRAITRKELHEIGVREGLQQARLTLEWSDRLIEHLARVGFDARFGARPLQRTLEREVVTPLARFLLDHAGLEGITLQADWQNGRVVFAV